MWESAGNHRWGYVEKVVSEAEFWIMFGWVANRNFARDERDRSYHPALVSREVNMNEYSNVVIVIPIWWYTIPMATYSFLDRYDLSSKNVFHCHNPCRERSGRCAFCHKARRAECQRFLKCVHRQGKQCVIVHVFERRQLAGGSWFSESSRALT